MADIDRGGADIAESLLPRAQTKIDILEISAMIALRHRAYGIEAGARHVEAKSNSVRNVHDVTRVDSRGYAIELLDLGHITGGICPIRNWKTRELAVV